jgi:WD repeat-containing protein 19
MDSVVRLCLEKLRQPERAFDIVRTTASSSGATMLSKYCQEMSDWKGAMEFLLMAKQSGEAFELAKSHGQMAAFTDALGNRVTPNDAIAVAKYYESQHEMALAGKFYTLCGQVISIPLSSRACYHEVLLLFLS